ncbi:hypothetical protein GCM10010193_09270 [Kitasatospora atroaurantiaca]|uniref:KTSC domain-containing protein n=1 Tax=Kitasatospora atroaurantiaca TaxID=285545 RepID=A0A561ERY7_9ACTN|nr:KTSC domain-containing protein [Kitasatospora atroaurantiaca]TWE18378.1 KTSC domain-containing protein [Kitasatospora atroaurantiaca]
MVREDVESSALRSVGYDRGGHVLEIEFVSSSVYQYSGVPGRIHRALMAAASHGRYFNQAIRGRYTYRRIT